MKVYLNGQLAEPEPGQRVVLTRQANDITKPDAIQADYSNTVRFPKTTNNRQIFGFAEEVDSNTLTPYQYQEAQLLSEGVEVLPYGKFELKESAEAYEGTLFSGNIRFFDALGEKKLAELDLTEFNHAWNRANIVANLQNTANFFYSLLAIGRDFVPENVHSTMFYPLTYVKMLWERIFQEAGFSYDMEEPPQFAKEFIPVNFTPKYSKEFTQARSYYGYVPLSSMEQGGQSQGRSDILRSVPYVNTDVLPFFASTNGNYNRNTLTYTADKAIVIDINATSYANLPTSIGTSSARLFILHNGVEVAYHYIRTTDEEAQGPLNEMNLKANVKDLLLLPGDTLEALILLKGETFLAGVPTARWGFTLYHYGFGAGQGQIGPEQRTGASLQITVKDTFPEGGEIDLTNWLPDMTQKEFVKAMVKQFGWTMQTDAYENKIRLTLFNAVLRNRPQAKVWTGKRDFSKLPAVGYTFGDFGQKNFFKWKEDERNPEGYGDGVITVANETLKPEYEALTMPFAATTHYLTYPNVEVWEKQEDGSYNSRKVSPRVLLRSEQKTTFGITEGGTTQMVQGFKTYFADAAEPYDLDMQHTIIPGFYDTLLSILNKCKRVKAYYLLSAQDVQEFDQSIPIYDADLGQYFYLNQIEQYEEGKPTLVHLYRLGEPINQ